MTGTLKNRISITVFSVDPFRGPRIFQKSRSQHTVLCRFMLGACELITNFYVVGKCCNIYVLNFTRHRTKFSNPGDPACTYGLLTSPIRGIFEIVPLILDIRHVGRWIDVSFHIYFINFVQRVLYKENVRETCSL
jgi:hypothetical protein